jgi:hypothetical protein
VQDLPHGASARSLGPHQRRGEMALGRVSEGNGLTPVNWVCNVGFRLCCAPPLPLPPRRGRTPAELTGWKCSIAPLANGCYTLPIVVQMKSPVSAATPTGLGASYKPLAGSVNSICPRRKSVVNRITTNATFSAVRLQIFFDALWLVAGNFLKKSGGCRYVNVYSADESNLVEGF